MKLKKWMIDNIQHFNNTIISSKEDPQKIVEEFKKLGINVSAEKRQKKISMSYTPNPIVINYIFVCFIC